uniref:Uncharacterized protein n=1 Tax=Arundo donax TaxID=35708 RepID=A0A0A9H994_ARUDO
MASDKWKRTSPTGWVTYVSLPIYCI